MPPINGLKGAFYSSPDRYPEEFRNLTAQAEAGKLAVYVAQHTYFDEEPTYLFARRKNSPTQVGRAYSDFVDEDYYARPIDPEQARAALNPPEVTKEIVRFCVDCPLANGVEEIADKCRGDSTYEPFEFAYVDAGDATKVSKNILAVPPRRSWQVMDGGAAQATADAFKRDIKACEGTVQAEKKRLGGLLGTRATSHCGAFPEHDPKHVKVQIVQGRHYRSPIWD